MRARVLGACCAALFCGCVMGPIVPPVGEPEAGTPADCDRACANLRKLGCPEGNPTLGEDGKPGTGDESTCEQTCKDVESSGYTTINSKCAAEIKACSDLERCGWSAQ